MIEIDYARAVELVEQCIAERGSDYTYEKAPGENCLYVHPLTYVNEYGEDEQDWEIKSPGCLVGMALNKAGVSLDRLMEKNSQGSNEILDWLRERGECKYSKKADSFLSKVQLEQDRGTPWGQALDLAFGMSENLGYDVSDDVVH